MTPLQSLYADAIFRLSGLTWLEGVDLLLVMVTFYLLLSLLRRSRAGFLMRGTLSLVAVLLIVTIILPLPTFDWLIRVSLIAIAVGAPLIFQPELRRLLERVGRTTGMGRVVRQTAAENVLSSLVQAVEHMSAGRTGALIVLEGNASLQAEIETGVPFGGQVTKELLQSIFYPGAPLHDGAVILRDDRVAAAGCVLPLTQQPLHTRRRLGTRHRAAVGLSEAYDALVVAVSEETGAVSVARDGKLLTGLNSVALREQVINFFRPPESAPPRISPWNLLCALQRRLFPRPSRAGAKQLLSGAGLLFVSLLLALAAWSFVVEQTNPAQRFRVDTIPLRVADVPEGMTLVSPPPANVSAVVQTTANLRPTLRQGSFQAVVSAAGLAPGLHHLPVTVHSGASRVRVLSIDPPALDLDLAPVISRTLPVTVEIPDQQDMSPAYKLVGPPAAAPEQVQVVGAASLVERVSQVQVAISIAGASASLQEMRPLRALDEEGREVTGLTLEPNQAQVRAPIHRRLNARDVGVRVLTDGTPPTGYWLSGLTVSPANVTIQGSPDRLNQIGNFVDTLPVDISQAMGNLDILIPLDLPPEVEALDSAGSRVSAVTVTAQATARTGDLVISRPVEILGATETLTVTLNPPQVNLLLNGPLPTLTQVETDGDMIRVWVDVADLSPGESADLSPTVQTPAGIQAQLMPPSVLVEVDDNAYASLGLGN